MGTSDLAFPRYNSIYSGISKIGDKGCRYLSQGKWELLTILSLGDNEIRAKGCRHLTKGRWLHLNKMYLGTAALRLGNNKIGDCGCGDLIHGNWAQLTLLNIGTLGDLCRKQQHWGQRVQLSKSREVGLLGRTHHPRPLS